MNKLEIVIATIIISMQLVWTFGKYALGLMILGYLAKGLLGF